MTVVKVILQTQDQVSGSKKYNGMMSAAAGVYREGGISGLYRGTVATLVRDAPGSAVYFAAYEYFRTLLTPEGAKSPSYGAVLFSGGMAGVAMWSFVIPPDVIKSRMQAAPPGTFKGFFDCGIKVVSKDGPSALFRGLKPALLRAFPANAAGFLGRAVAIEVMNKLW